MLIISDMEFDQATASGYVPWENEKWDRPDETLFRKIERRYQENGYRMPRLIFWNVCGRTNTIPKVDNEEGLCLLSGFSQNAMRVAANKQKKDPYEALIALLDSPRYRVIGEAIERYVA